MLALIRWLSRLSPVVMDGAGWLLGWIAYALSPSYRDRLRENAELAGLAPQQRRMAIAAAGRMVAELPRLWLRPLDRDLGPGLRWEGESLIETALDAGRGLVLLTPHLGSFEVCAQAIAERFGHRTRLTALYRPARQEWLSRLQETARTRPGLATAPASLAGVRQMIRALRRGEAVGLLPDQVPPLGLGVWAPFFGRPAYTMTLAARLIEQTGAAWLLIWAERIAGGEAWIVRVLPPPSPLPRVADSDSALQVECATAINREMERLIRCRPEQYLWGYHRYKSPRRDGGAE